MKAVVDKGQTSGSCWHSKGGGDPKEAVSGTASSSSHSRKAPRKVRSGGSGSSSNAPKNGRLQYCAANNTFVMSPLTSRTEECFLNPDAVLPWSQVISAAVPFSTSQSACMDDDSNICPICLDNMRVPQIIRCGHTYCLTCILRFLLYADSNAKCPVCNHAVKQEDLRPTTKVVRIPPPKHLSVQESKPTDAPVFELTLLAVPRNLSLCPRSLPQQLDSTAANSTDSMFVLNTDNALARFSRLTIASIEWVRTLQTTEQNELLCLHRDCLRTTGDLTVAIDQSTGQSLNADMEYLPSVELALELLLMRQRNFEQQLREAEGRLRAFPGCLDIDSVAAAAMAAKYPPLIEDCTVLLARSASLLEAEINANKKKGKFPSLPSRSVHIKSGIKASTEPVVLDISEQSPTCAESTPKPSARSMFDKREKEKKVIVDPEDPSFSLFYQASSGHLTFLHPMCLRALLMNGKNGNVRSPKVVSKEKDTVLEVTRPPEEVLCTLVETLNVRILEVEPIRITSESRSRYPFLRHLPLGCDSVNLLEIDLRPLVHKSVLTDFQDDIQRRKQRRKRQQQVKARETDADMARLVTHAMHVDDLLARQAVLRAEEESRLESLFNSPAIVSAALPSAITAGVKSAEVRDNVGNKTQMSFAKITSSGGYYPSLKESLNQSSGPALTPALSKQAGAWGKVATSETKKEPDLWPRGATASSTTASAGGDANKKDQRKGKKISLFG